MFADDGWRDRRDICRDQARIAHDRRELRRDLYYGNYGAARHERNELRREYRDLNQDRRDLYWRPRASFASHAETKTPSSTAGWRLLFWSNFDA